MRVVLKDPEGQAKQQQVGNVERPFAQRRDAAVIHRRLWCRGIDRIASCQSQSSATRAKALKEGHRPGVKTCGGPAWSPCSCQCHRHTVTLWDSSSGEQSESCRLAGL